MPQSEMEKLREAYNSVDPNAEYNPPAEGVGEGEVTPPVESEPPKEAAQEGDAVVVNQEGEGVVEGEQTPPPPAYEPNFKFNVRGQEMEFDEQIRPFVKDKETEEYVRTLMAKAHGLESVQTARDKYKSELEEVRPRFENIMGELQKMAYYREQGNLDLVFQTLGLTEEQVLNYAAQRIQYQQMTPEQRQAYDSSVRQQAHTYDLSQQNQTLQQRYESQLQQMKDQEINLVLSRPDVASFAQQFDQRMGQSGAFKDAIWQRGQYHAMVNQVDIPVQQAVDEVLKMVGAGTLEPPQAAPTQTQAPQPPASQQPAAKPPVIPKVSGSGASPTRQPVKSIADLRNRRQEIFGS